MLEVSKKAAITASLINSFKPEDSVSDNGPSGSGKVLDTGR